MVKKVTAGLGIQETRNNPFLGSTKTIVNRYVLCTYGELLM